MTSGIYKITNSHTGKSYIGQSKNIEKRINDHIKELNEGTHHNKDLQKDWLYYDFEWTILEETQPDRNILNKKELLWIKHFDSKRNGYNKTRGGDVRVNPKLEVIGNDRWKICSHCRRRINGIAKRCPYCHNTSFVKYHEPKPIPQNNSKWKICSGCGKRINAVAKSCPYCHNTSFFNYHETKQIQDTQKNSSKWKKCPRCSRKINRVAKRCPYCGYKY